MSLTNQDAVALVDSLFRCAAALERIADALEASGGRPFPETTPTAAAPNVFLCFHCGKSSALPPDLTRGFACTVCGAAYPPVVASAEEPTPEPRAVECGHTPDGKHRYRPVSVRTERGTEIRTCNWCEHQEETPLEPSVAGGAAALEHFELTAREHDALHGEGWAPTARIDALAGAVIRAQLMAEAARAKP